MAFVDGLIDNDDKVTSFKEHTQFNIIECKNHTLFITKMAKIA